MTARQLIKLPLGISEGPLIEEGPTRMMAHHDPPLSSLRGLLVRNDPASLPVPKAKLSTCLQEFVSRRLQFDERVLGTLFVVVTVKQWLTSASFR